MNTWTKALISVGAAATLALGVVAEPSPSRYEQKRTDFELAANANLGSGPVFIRV